MSSDIPRDPDHYRLSDHAFIRCKERGIDTELVAKAIAEGAPQEAKEGHPHQRFLKQVHFREEPLAVVANVSTGEISTVFWSYKYDHPEANQ